ncbi:MAG: thiamine pyrophosphate-dependent enzyme [Thermodesulfobacteriota bacterium]
MSWLMDAPAGTVLLLQGNQAIARGAVEGGLAWAGGYPGNPSSEIIETLAEARTEGRLYVEWSVNEKVALEGAAAASLSGLRAMVTMKQNGINVCLDSLTMLALSGIRAGLVVAVADDPAAISSSNEQDSRFVAALAHVPLLEPSSPQEALEMARFGLELSEAIGNIVVLRSVSRLSHTRANVRLGAVPPKPDRPKFDTGLFYHCFPVIQKHQALYDKLDRAREICDRTGFNSYEGPDEARLMVIASGPSYYYAREALEMTGLSGQAGLLKIGTTWPLPEKLILRHLAVAEEVLVVEEIDPVLERQVKTLAAQAAPEIGVKWFHGKSDGRMPAAGEVTPDTVAQALGRITGGRFIGDAAEYRQKAAAITGRMVPPREFGFCPGCPHRASFWAIKNVLADDDRLGFVSGDIGCYTMGVWPTGFHMVKSVHAMGSGVGMSSGFGKLGEFGFDQPVISVVGDSTFFHAAVPALINATYNRSGFLLVVLDNSATAMTGFQPHPGTGRSASGGEAGLVEIERVCASLGCQVTLVDPYDLAAAQEALTRGLGNLDRVQVLIFRRKCALVQGREGGFPYRMSIDGKLCRGVNCGCNRYCNRVFRCPGLNYDARAGRAVIDEVICVGCGVCEQVCPAGAIRKETK